MSSDVIGQTEALFTAWDRPGSPGCAVGIIRDGTLVYRRGFGRASLEHDLPINDTTVFDIASTSKQFTAACIGLLLEDGRLGLDDVVRDHIPELPDLGPVTIRHLIHHTSGWRDYLTLFELAGYREADYFDTAEVLAMLARQQGLNFAPGDRYDYSNTGYYLLGLIVERVSGRTLAQFAHDHIFAPLGMERTWYQDDHTRIVPGRATGYSPRAEGGYYTDVTSLDIPGDGAVLTCVRDLVHWDRNFYDNQLGRGGTALIDRMTTPGQLTDGSPVLYGFGLDLVPYRGRPTVSHGGWFAGYRAEMMCFPGDRFTVICLTNASDINPTRLCLRVADLWLDDWPDSPAPATAEPSTAATSAPTEGLYFDAAAGRVMSIERQGDEQAADFGAGPRPLRLMPSGRWQTADDMYDLVVENDSLVVRLYDRPFGTYTPVTPVSPTPDELSRYAGDYASPDLAVTYHCSVVDGALWLQYGRREPAPLTPAQQHVFRHEDRTLVFRMAPGGRPVGFTLGGNRAWGFRFARVPGADSEPQQPGRQTSQS